MAQPAADIQMVPPIDEGMAGVIDNALHVPIPIVPLAHAQPNLFGPDLRPVSSLGIACNWLALPDHFGKVTESKVKVFATLLSVLENHRTRLAKLKTHWSESTFPDTILRAVRPPQKVFNSDDQDVCLDPLRLELLKKQIRDAVSRIETTLATLVLETDKIRNTLLSLVDSHAILGLPRAKVLAAHTALADLDNFRKSDYFHAFYNQVLIMYTEFRSSALVKADKKAETNRMKEEKRRLEIAKKQSPATIENVEEMLRTFAMKKDKKPTQGRGHSNGQHKKTSPKNVSSGGKKSPTRRTAKDSGSNKTKKKNIKKKRGKEQN